MSGVVIIGNGVAGITLARELRKRSDTPITIISEETPHFYSRPALMYLYMGTRVWCRFGCPQAAILGILQKRFSRFRITTNGSQCMSCGHCSAYCEMGIDVRWYAQRGQNIVRASCVGCGMCASVCPRGVLRLENGPRNNRFSGTIDPARRRKGIQNREQ